MTPIVWTDVTRFCHLGAAVGCEGVSILVRIPDTHAAMDIFHPTNRRFFHVAYDRTFRVWTNLEEYTR